MKHKPTLRIIGGKWRGRKVSFKDQNELSPTGERVRETLFNWLMHDIKGARCLDLFSGTGILGIEALSRGASRLTFIEQDAEIAAQLNHNLTLLNTDQFNLITTDAIPYLKATNHVFDIIFLDPPFGRDHLKQAGNIIAERRLCANFVYIESESALAFDSLPDNWQIYRQKKAGRVNYGLIAMP